MKKITILSIALLISAATLEYPKVGLQLRAIGQTPTPQTPTPQPPIIQPQIPQPPTTQPPTPQTPTPQTPTPQPKAEDPKKLGYVSPEFAERFSQQQIDQINANVETLLLTQSCVRCDLRAIKLVNIRLKNAIVTGADLSDASLSGSTFEISDFVNTNMA
ncbi:MAG: pentapeptide repeat-containing protein, partial [Oscillatoriales cyanobacterium]